MLLTIIFLLANNSFFEAQQFNLCWTFYNKILFTSIEPKDNHICGLNITLGIENIDIF
jgi:hypothetical protein